MAVPLAASDERPSSVDRVPTLTEVVEWHGGDSAAQTALSSDAVAAQSSAASDAPATTDLLPQPPTLPASMPAAPPAADLVAQVLAELQPRVDSMLQTRLREALAPALARVADGLIRDARGELTAALHDLVREAVARVLEHQRRR